MNKITILGLGNPLLKDDGIGPRIVEELQKVDLPEGVQAVNGRGSIYQYLDILAVSEKVIAVDALQGGSSPGTVYLLNGSKIVQGKEGGMFKHEDYFLSVLDFISGFAAKPEVIVIGIEPKEISCSLELSPEVKAKIPAVIKLIGILCQRSGGSANLSAFLRFN